MLDEDYNYFENKLDFGVDAEQILEMKDKFIQTSFNTRSHEHEMRPNKEINLTEEEIQKRLKNFKNKEDRYVNEGYKGFGKEPYVLLNWIPMKKQKKDHVNQVFQEIVHRSHYNEHYFRPKVRRRLHLGPREASKGYGLK